jgi:hypothetical protein
MEMVVIEINAHGELTIHGRIDRESALKYAMSDGGREIHDGPEKGAIWMDDGGSIVAIPTDLPVATEFTQ